MEHEGRGRGSAAVVFVLDSPRACPLFHLSSHGASNGLWVYGAAVLASPADMARESRNHVPSKNPPPSKKKTISTVACRLLIYVEICTRERCFRDALISKILEVYAKQNTKRNAQDYRI